MSIWDDFRQYIFDDSSNENDDGEIESEFDAKVQQFGSFYTDPSFVPLDAQLRPNGAFVSPNDLQNYLFRGGLLFETDTGFAQNPIIHIVKVPFSDAGFLYQVYISPTTP